LSLKTINKIPFESKMELLIKEYSKNTIVKWDFIESKIIPSEDISEFEHKIGHRIPDWTYICEAISKLQELEIFSATAASHVYLYFQECIKKKSGQYEPGLVFVGIGTSEENVPLEQGGTELSASIFYVNDTNKFAEVVKEYCDNNKDMNIVFMG
jgi:hypothetical protein